MRTLEDIAATATDRAIDVMEAGLKAESLHNDIARAVKHVILQALRQACAPPEPSPVSAEELRALRDWADFHANIPSSAHHTEAVDLRTVLADRNHLERLCAFLMHEGEVYAQAYRRGFKDGAAAQKDACIHVAKDAACRSESVPHPLQPETWIGQRRLNGVEVAAAVAGTLLVGPGA
jgi:hypothetical protein